jgi:hypothetical protein
MSTTALPPVHARAVDLAAAARVRAAAGRDQRDLRDAGAAAGRGLDFLLALSMAASIIVFLSAVQIRRAVELERLSHPAAAADALPAGAEHRLQPPHSAARLRRARRPPAR